MTIIINTNEMNALRYITKPSSYQRLYSKLGEINSMDGKLNEYLGKRITQWSMKYMIRRVLLSKVL